jgi:hypothetical protein
MLQGMVDFFRPGRIVVNTHYMRDGDTSHLPGGDGRGRSPSERGMNVPTVPTAHIHLHIGAEEPTPKTVAAHDHHNGGRVPTGDLLLLMQERLGLGVALSGRPQDLVTYLEACIAAIRATELPLAEVG